LCLVFFFLFAINSAETLTSWGDGDWASEQIKNAKNMEELTQLFHRAVSSVRWAQFCTDYSIWLVTIATVSAFVFFCVNVYRIGKLHREISKDEHDA
jgi:hypothetical protein